MRRAILAALVLGLALLALTAALALPGVAAAQSGDTSPFSPGLPASPAPTPTASTPTPVTPVTTSTGGGSLGGSGIVVITIGAIVILGGISLFIWYDARRRAPVRHRMAGARSPDGGRSTPRRTKPRKLSPAERRRRKRGRAR